MRVALVQDWFTVNGGAEKVIREMINLYPDADVFALVDFLNDTDRMHILNGKRVTTTFIQQLPFSRKWYRNYLPFFPKAIESLDLSSYDLIISSSYSVAKGVKKRPGQLHICYCHSPMRYAWDLEEEYLSHLGFFKRLLAKQLLKNIRKWDLRSNEGVDLFIANSRNVAERIKRIYNRDSVVLYPPVDTSQFSPVERKENYYFTSARMVPYKKIDLIIRTFNQLPQLKLRVAGDGPEYAKLKGIAGANVTFDGFLEKKDLITAVQNAKAFVLAADEDFGITSVEAQSCCTPVIAYKKGGYLETVIEGKTGIFFAQQTISSLQQAITEFEARTVPFKKDDFLMNVANFTECNFQSGLKSIIEKTYAERKGK